MNVAVTVASSNVPAWQRDCIAALRALDAVTVRVVAVSAPPWRPPRLGARLAGPALVPARVEVDGGEPDEADVVLDLSGAYDAPAAAAPPFGVWAFRLGDSDDHTFPFARETAAGDPTVDVVLARRFGERREILRRGRFPVTAWYPSTLRLALAEAARWPAVLVCALRDGLRPAAEPDGGAARRAPLGPLERVRFAAMLARRLGAYLSEGLFEVVEWNAGFAEGGARALLSGEPLRVRWLTQPAPFSFVADPFVIEHGGTRALFVEDFDYRRNRGVIDALVLDDQGEVVRRVRALDLPTHLSYPYPVQLGDELYIVPENCAAKEVALYRCVEFPGRWERAQVVLPFDGVDTTLFEHEGRWWAFCTRWSHGSNVALQAFHAETLQGPWAPHALNPIVVDVTRARPAGQPFVVDGVLYRPGQDCARSYGAGVAIARVDELTPQTYRETVVRRIDGRDLGRYADGIHTVSFSRGLVVVDGKHVYHNAGKLAWAARRLRQKIARIVTRRVAGAPSPA